jgi:hypothetical protein
VDNITKKIKIATHVTFDEAGYTVPPAQRTPLQEKLQLHGIKEDQQEELTDIPTTSTTSKTLLIKKLSSFGIIPQRATEDAAGYDIYSAKDITLPPWQLTSVPTDLAITPPERTAKSYHAVG